MGSQDQMPNSPLLPSMTMGKLNSGSNLNEYSKNIPVSSGNEQKVSKLMGTDKSCQES